MRSPSGLTRRAFALGGAAGLGASLAGLPTVWAKRTFSIRVLGTHVTLQEDLRRRAEADLGISIHFEPGGSARVLHQAATRPESFDLYEQWSNSIRVLWQARAIQPIDVGRIRYWDDVNSLSKTGRLSPDAGLGRGDAPHTLVYAQRDGTLGSNPTRNLSFLPYVHNVDSFGYHAGKIPRGRPYETESWGWLLDPAHRGKVALVNAPTIGLFDAALAAQATGQVRFEDIGDITREELDALFKILIDLKHEGHFRGVWSSVPESVEMMRRDEVVLESMFSPAAATLNGDGIPCVYAAPKEGYRAWHGVMCLSSSTVGPQRDAAYEYMNWWLSGWPGAFIARQGYYISTPHLSRPHLSEDEWRYWYAGEPTRTSLTNPVGQVSVPAGAVRNGGSYQRRFAHVAVWNTVMNTYEYSLRRWSDFLLG
ncbi:MAG: extracellular solute-binding protein [Deltaproteobacteria bacterium]|nr:extracellular solute-binding protein [Deltaproteobacteria bacterium]